MATVDVANWRLEAVQALVQHAACGAVPEPIGAEASGDEVFVRVQVLQLALRFGATMLFEREHRHLFNALSSSRLAIIGRALALLSPLAEMCWWVIITQSSHPYHGGQPSFPEQQGASVGRLLSALFAVELGAVLDLVSIDELDLRLRRRRSGALAAKVQLTEAAERRARRHMVRDGAKGGGELGGSAELRLEALAA